MSDIRIATAEDQILLDKEAKYCSYGDTVHYIEPPRIFSRCEGSYVWDTEDQAYLDLQMWYSAVNFGYANPRLNNALKQQIDTLPQIASQYLHKGKIELSEMIAVDAKKKFGLDGRVHFNVGGSQSIEDSLKVVRNASNGKSLMFAFRRAVLAGTHSQGIESYAIEVAVQPTGIPFLTHAATPYSILYLRYKTGPSGPVSTQLLYRSMIALTAWVLIFDESLRACSILFK